MEAVGRASAQRLMNTEARWGDDVAGDGKRKEDEQLEGDSKVAGMNATKKLTLGHRRQEERKRASSKFWHRDGQAQTQRRNARACTH